MDLDTLIATHRRPLERHLRRRVGDPSLAEDLAQEVFLRAWLHAPAGLTDPRLRAWLYRVATNVAIDALRARAGRVGGIASDGALLDALERAAAPEAEDHDERLAIETALAQLPARERALVTLQFAGYGPTDAARLLQTTPEAARKRLARARERFRRAYAATAPATRPLVLLLVRDEDPAPYERWLGGAELRVQRVADGQAAARQLATAHALVLTGADEDVHPALYGQQIRSARAGSLDGDRADAAILRDALAGGLPVLGICRGHQLLNVLHGGTLHQDLGSEGATERPELHADRRMHAVATGGDSLTRRIVGPRASVPSLHHQAIDRLGAGLRVTARSADGIVEGVEDPRHPFAVGVQWHAELPEAGISGRRVRDALADAALRHAAAEPPAVAA
ncbi:MAG: sigma-70 family RNA polymerase sigma factor [Actinobacteria bacterium]|nr:sigma-70 family RNA polymerase sigma factor [Actinomycetota bacterium]